MLNFELNLSHFVLNLSHFVLDLSHFELNLSHFCLSKTFFFSFWTTRIPFWTKPIRLWTKLVQIWTKHNLFQKLSINNLVILSQKSQIYPFSVQISRNNSFSILFYFIFQPDSLIGDKERKKENFSFSLCKIMTFLFILFIFLPMSHFISFAFLSS